MYRYIISFVLVLLISSSLYCQTEEETNKWDQLKFLLGEWTGDGEGQPGNAEGISIFTSELDDNVIIRKSFAEYPAQNGRPAFRHEDLIVINKMNDGSIKASYYDNESHFINYTVDVSTDASTLTFFSEKVEGQPLFKMTYAKQSENKLTFAFEIAMSGKAEDLSKYIEAVLVKK